MFVDARMQVVEVVSRRDIVDELAGTDRQIEHDVKELLHWAGCDWEVGVADGFVEVSGPVGEVEERLAKTVARSVAGVHAVHVLA